eukprot:TRINITY_DN4134_c0_g1_i1.p1 TRINITY_DN4134_c0_g1~~TRINITY_DN4134_c0_g1_i1.p1  ORF type:complete len:177 (+),score=33.41 TRINITY_DN4134_c0_g1_i1:201-731(+)
MLYYYVASKRLAAATRGDAAAAKEAEGGEQALLPAPSAATMMEAVLSRLPMAGFHSCDATTAGRLSCCRLWRQVGSCNELWALVVKRTPLSFGMKSLTWRDVVHAPLVRLAETLAPLRRWAPNAYRVFRCHRGGRSASSAKPRALLALGVVSWAHNADAYGKHPHICRGQKLVAEL